MIEINCLIGSAIPIIQLDQYIAIDFSSIKFLQSLPKMLELTSLGTNLFSFKNLNLNFYFCPQILNIESSFLKFCSCLQVSFDQPELSSDFSFSICKKLCIFIVLLFVWYFIHTAICFLHYLIS